MPASPHEGAGSKGAAPFQAKLKEAGLRGSYDASSIGIPCRKFCEAYGTG
ncbi:MAG: hypothetical protein JST37_14410 [Bacteroidetes bacterium]|nr:hypothetical protein [Bacteroidota bacterium]